MRGLRLLALASIVLTSAAARSDDWNGLRSSICGVGDVNGDGIPDLAVASRDGRARGKVWIFSGSNGALIRTMESGRDHDGFGSSVVAVGDLDGDGVVDLAVGSRGWSAADDRPSDPKASVRIVSGRTGVTLFELSTGWIVTAVGDIDGDGVSDLAASCPDIGSRKPGSVFLHSGRTGAIIYALRAPSDLPDLAAFGSSMAGVGDIDDDGIADFVVGSPFGWEDNSPGCIDLFSGIKGTWLMRVKGSDPEGRFGWSMASIGDLDGDAKPDLLVGEVHRSVLALSGRDLHPIQRIGSACGIGYLDAFASSLDPIGDVDFDCVPDYIVGANEAPGAFDEGYAWVVSGQTGRILARPFDSMDEDADASGIGDVNRDGVPDVALSIEYKPTDNTMKPSQNECPRRRIRAVSGATWQVLWEVDPADRLK
jgi:hypothetical protein